MASFETPLALMASAFWRIAAMSSSRVMETIRPVMRPAYHLLRRLAMPEPGIQLADQLLGGFRDHRARREDGFGAGRIERVVILRRHHAADDDHDVLAAVLLQRGLQFGHCGEVGCRQRRDA